MFFAFFVAEISFQTDAFSLLSDWLNSRALEFYWRCKAFKNVPELFSIASFAVLLILFGRIRFVSNQNLMCDSLMKSFIPSESGLASVERSSRCRISSDLSNLTNFSSFSSKLSKSILRIL